MPRAAVEPIGPPGPGMLEQAALEAGAEGVLLDRAALAALGPVASLRLGPPEQAFRWDTFYDAIWVSKAGAPHRVAPGCPAPP